MSSFVVSTMFAIGLETSQSPCPALATPAVSGAQGDCQLVLKNCGNSDRSREPIMHRMWEVPESILGTAKHTVANRAICHPIDSPIAT